MWLCRGLLFRFEIVRQRGVNGLKINDKEFKDWTEGDLQEIIENDVYRENEFWDYKQTFAVLECQDKESKRKKQNEFRHDICSFANAEGGYLIVGVMEEAGVPTEINGIGISNTDKFELDRRNELSGILPVVPKVEFSFIKLLNGNYVVVIRIYRGMYKPYLYRENEDNYRFYVRRGNRKQAMSYMEIRDDFLHSNLLSEEIKRFRKERLLSYIEEYPNTPFAIVQVIPADFVNVDAMSLLYNEYKEKNIKFHDIFNGLCYGHIFPNVDGISFPNYGYDNGIYLQLYNNGISELFYKLDIREKNGGKWLCMPGILENMRSLVEGAKELFALQERHTMAYICVTISGCKGLWSDSDFKTDYCAQVDRQEINCMPVEIHDITDDDMVEQAINTCAMIMNYSVGRKSR